MQADNNAYPSTGLSPLRIGAGTLAGGMLAGLAVIASYILLMTPHGPFAAFSHGLAGGQSELSLGQGRVAAGTRVLTGISGEALSADSRPIVSLIHLTRNDEQAAEISPLAFDRISAGDCITVTTASGQKLSFQIVGARQRDDQIALDPAPKIDLSVTACAHNSEAIAKAVIESKTSAPVSEGPLPRSL